MPLIAFPVCLALLFNPQVKAWPLLRAAIAVFALACFYIAGEEMSWGQWFFHWNTPEYWSEINRQDETNLHNTSYFLNQFPQTLLEISVVIGGLILPLSAAARRLVSAPIIEILTPSVAIVPVALMAVFFKAVHHLDKKGWLSGVLARPSEATETFLYMFILFYVILLRRRLAQSA